MQLAPDGAFRAGDREGHASVLELEPGIFSIIVEGRCYEARVRDGVVYVNGERYDVTVEDPRMLKAAKAGSGAGRSTLKAAMPGKVVRVLVNVGDRVEVGAGLLVVEAMKMQNELKAPVSGTVASISAAVGSAVSAGDVLVVVEAS